MSDILFVVLSLLSVTKIPVNYSLPVLIDEVTVTGSAVKVSPRLILTAAHVVKSIAMFVLCPEGLVPIELLKLNEGKDLALFRLGSVCTSPIPTLVDSNPYPGEEVFAMGCPGYKCGLLTRGIVSGYTVADNRVYLISDVKVYKGSSGGPLMTSDGYLYGICSEILTMAEKDTQLRVNFGLFITPETIKEFLTNSK